MSIQAVPIRRGKSVRDQGRVGIYDSNSRDWTTGMALVEKLFPEYKN